METRPDYTPELRRVTQPALLLWGDADPISPLEVGRRLRDLLPDATLHLVPDGDHSFAHDRPGEIAGAIRDHLA